MASSKISFHSQLIACNLENMKFHRYGPLMSENQGARLKIGPLICIPPEGHYNNTLQLRIKANEYKSHNNEEALTTMATKTDLNNLEVCKKSRLTATQTKHQKILF